MGIDGVEGVEVLAVDIEDGYDVVLRVRVYGGGMPGTENRDNDLAAGLAAAGDVAREFLYIGYHEGLPLLPGGTADTPAISDMGTGHGSLERAEDQFVTDDTVEARPPEMESLVQHGGGVGHAGNPVLFTVEDGGNLFIQQLVFLFFALIHVSHD